MSLRYLLFVPMLAVASSAFATGTGPTYPDDSRQQPLDAREPAQQTFEGDSDVTGQQRPPTLEAPPDVSPAEPDEAPKRPGRPDAQRETEGPAPSR